MTNFALIKMWMVLPGKTGKRKLQENFFLVINGLICRTGNVIYSVELYVGIKGSIFDNVFPILLYDIYLFTSNSWLGILIH